ncbi:MAG: hypothetical protein H7175_27740 [Burkholderiales bacterium]|nr:hypothetical protein [Anaerolineae bacterium]
MFRVPVDFNTQRFVTLNDEKVEIVRINTHYDAWLLDYLKPGLHVLLFTSNDFEVEGVVEYYEEWKRWIGIPEWSTVRYLARVDFDTLPTNTVNKIPISDEQMKFLLHLIEANERMLLEADTFEVDAEFVFDEEKRAWYAIPDWSTRRNFDILPPVLPASD